MLFPRMYDGKYAGAYKDWTGMKGKPVTVTTAVDQNGNPYPGNQQTRIKPTFLENLQFFFNYQLNHMYWRYFLWNFAGRQNDIQGNGEVTHGNWISGIPFYRQSPPRRPVAASRTPRQGQQGTQRVLYAAASARYNRNRLAVIHFKAWHRAILGGCIPLLHDRNSHRALPEPDTQPAP